MLIAMLSLAAALQLQNDPNHTTASFAVKHLMINTVRGEFRKASSTIQWDKDNPANSSVEVTIDVSSIDTRTEKRDADLKSPNFFDAAKCPEITFKSTKVEPAGGDKFKVTGDLTMHCQTHPITLDAEFTTKPIQAPWGGEVYAGSTSATLKRSEWGLTWNKPIDKAGGVMVSDEVKLEVDAEYHPAAPAKK